MLNNILSHSFPFFELYLKEAYGYNEFDKSNLGLLQFLNK